MIIKTITCHDVYNVGASLQAYALQKYLENAGHNVEIIDYKPDYLSNHFPLWGVHNPRFDCFGLAFLYCVAKLPFRLKNRYGKRKKEFDRFTGEFLKLTKRYNTFDELVNCPPKADVYIAGSDQIWNPLFRNGKDPAFYLSFGCENVIRASYAASFSVESLPEDVTEKVANWIKYLEYVSVRETSGLRILQSLGFESGYCVVDPVFLISRSDWEHLADQWTNPQGKPYLIIYDFDSNHHINKFARKIAEERNLEIVSIFSNDEFKKNYKDEGPIAFLKLIKDADAIISNSFHATAFSIIFQKEFWTFNRTEHINTRIRDILNSLGLIDRIDGKMTDEIDYSRVNDILQHQIDASKQYLEKILGGSNEKEENSYCN